MLTFGGTLHLPVANRCGEHALQKRSLPRKFPHAPHEPYEPTHPGGGFFGSGGGAFSTTLAGFATAPGWTICTPGGSFVGGLSGNGAADVASSGDVSGGGGTWGGGATSSGDSGAFGL